MGLPNETLPRHRGGFGRLSYSGTRPWPEVPVGNHEHDSAAVVIIGGGIAGMCMAIDLLKNHKIKIFIIIEKGGGFGGTWRDNKFPGCCCDVWSHLYCYSFEQNPDWSRAYPGQEEILNYLTDVAHKYQLYKYARFNTTIDKARWNDLTMKWETTVNVSGGKDAEFGNRYTIQCDFLVSGVGQLNLPRGIDVPGQGDYTGKIMHSARWDWPYHMDGERVAVIGTGAKTAQIVPELAKTTTHLTVIQGSPAWVIPRHDKPIPQYLRTLLKYIPPLRWRHRASAMDTREAFFHAVTQPSSPHVQHMRDLNQSILDTQLAHRPDLQAKLRPNYSPGCKRSVISDDYYPALARPNVELQTAKIERFTAKDIKFVGQDVPQEYDAVILATGFEPQAFLAPMKLTGRNGVPLCEIWASAPHAYKGATVPQLPNFGLLYGPNTNLTHNSLILPIESQTRYLSALISTVFRSRILGHPLSLSPRASITETYNADLQERLQATSFADPGCNSWWKRGEDGRIVNNRPGTAREYQEEVSVVGWGDYEMEGGGEAVPRGETWVGRVREERVVGDLVLGVMVVFGDLVLGVMVVFGLAVLGLGVGAVGYQVR